MRTGLFLTFFLLYAGTLVSFAQEADFKETSLQPSASIPVKALLDLSFKNDLNKIDEGLKHGRYARAIQNINQLLSKVKTKQNAKLDQFFPETFLKYESVQANDHAEEPYFSQGQFGVIYTRKYQNPRGANVEVHVIFADPSIKEYQNLIKNPRLIDGIENTQIVIIKNSYKALEKYSEEQEFIEQNIVLSSSLQINIVANGIKNKDVLADFSQGILFSKLEEYLNN